MAFKVLYPHDIGHKGRAFLNERGYETIVGSGWDEDTLLREIVDIDAVMAGSDPYTRRVLETGKKLKVIARFGVGCDSIDIPAATELGIYVCNTPQANSNAVAEHAIALVMALSKHVVLLDEAVKANNWRARDTNISVEVMGKTLGLVGLGNIGRRVAQKASLGLGMKVIACDPYLPADKFPEGVTKVAANEEVFAQSDFVSLHMPSTPETRGSVNKALLSKMKKTAYLVNCARGDVVNEADLHDILAKGEIAGAGLDVLVNEPPKPDNPILKLKNVILLPHTASYTPEAMDAMGMDAAKCIDEVLSGKAPTWPINKPVKK